MTTTTATMAAPTTRRRTPGWAGAFAGLIGAAVALGGERADRRRAVARVVADRGHRRTIIDLQPPGAKDFVVALFGTNDKLALEALVTGTALAIGALLGYLGRDRFAIASVGSSPSGSSASSRSCACHSHRHQSARWCRDRGHRRDPGHELADADRTPNGDRGPTGRHARLEPSEPAPHGFGDRGRALAGGVVGRMFGARASVAPRRPTTRFRPHPRSLPPCHRARTLRRRCRPHPIVMPNDRFYQIDTALLTPIVDSATWQCGSTAWSTARRR